MVPVSAIPAVSEISESSGTKAAAGTQRGNGRGQRAAFVQNGDDHRDLHFDGTFIPAKFSFWHAPEFHRKGRRGRKGIREMYPEIDFGNGLKFELILRHRPP